MQSVITIMAGEMLYEEYWRIHTHSVTEGKSLLLLKAADVNNTEHFLFRWIVCHIVTAHCYMIW